MVSRSVYPQGLSGGYFGDRHYEPELSTRMAATKKKRSLTRTTSRLSEASRGVLVAAQLVEQGHKVLVLEAGSGSARLPRRSAAGTCQLR